MPSTLQPTYATSASITISLSGIASGNAREGTAVDNTSNKYTDAILSLIVKLQAGTPSGQKAINIYAYGSEDGTNFGDNATGSDANITLRVPTNLRYVGSIQCPDSGALTYKSNPISVGRAFGGVLPRKWGIVVENQTGVTFSATEGDHTKSYTGINITGT